MPRGYRALLQRSEGSPRDPNWWWQEISMQNWRHLMEIGTTSRLRWIWQRQNYRIRCRTFCRNGDSSVRTGGRGSWSGWGGSCSPGCIISWWHIFVSSGMCLSGNQCITHTIKFLCSAYAALSWWNTQSTSKGTRGSLSDPWLPWQGKKDSLQPYRGQSWNRIQGRQGRMLGYWNPHGGSLNRGYPCDSTWCKTNPSYVASSMWSTQAWSQTCGGGWKRWDGT